MCHGGLLLAQNAQPVQHRHNTAEGFIQIEEVIIQPVRVRIIVTTKHLFLHELQDGIPDVDQG